jgi:5-oxoprolinase (ATP-hydrolysing)
VLRRVAPRAGALAAAAGRPDPVLLELFNNLFMSVAEQTGAVLQNTAMSVNIKERLDFSCAVFDAEGFLVANAPHIPVHLGAMGESVRTVLARRRGALKPGDVVALNNPYNGGTHLPDVTVITPVFDESGARVLFFVGSRGHHADIGGITPGSTPPASCTLEEEGVVIDDFLLVDGGRFREAELRALLAGARFPARSPDVNVADIKAQVAANEKGVRELRRVVSEHGWETVSAYMRHVMDNAEESVRRVVARLRDGAFDYTMDDGAALRVSVRVDRAARSARIDFTGTAAQRGHNNFNAPPAVTRAAVLYVFRCLVGEDIPLNDGCLKPLEILVPPGSFLAPRPGAAVVAGNTEVSQAVCNALFGALGAIACSQATMNNFIFGDATRQYYETICGGTGAGPGFDGTSAVQTHMTNTRMTDPEVLELRYPVRLETFAIRRGSGADDGGDRRLAPRRAAVRAGRRVGGGGGAAMGGAGGRAGRDPGWNGQRGDDAGRCVRHRDAGRRRVWRAGGGSGEKRCRARRLITGGRSRAHRPRGRDVPRRRPFGRGTRPGTGRRRS